MMEQPIEIKVGSKIQFTLTEFTKYSDCMLLNNIIYVPHNHFTKAIQIRGYRYLNDMHIGVESLKVGQPYFVNLDFTGFVKLIYAFNTYPQKYTFFKNGKDPFLNLDNDLFLIVSVYGCLIKHPFDNTVIKLKEL